MNSYTTGNQWFIRKAVVAAVGNGTFAVAYFNEPPQSPAPAPPFPGAVQVVIRRVASSGLRSLRRICFGRGSGERYGQVFGD